MSWRLLFQLMLVGKVSLGADLGGACPDLSGKWYCELFINGGREALEEAFVSSQKSITKSHVVYDIAGSKFEAKWEEETPLPDERDTEVTRQRVRCLNEETLLFWYEKSSIPFHHVFRRPNDGDLRIDTIQLGGPEILNHVVTRKCRLGR